MAWIGAWRNRTNRRDPRRRAANARGARRPARCRSRRAAFRRFGFVQSAIVARWPEIVGEQYARHSAPDALNFPAGKRSGATLAIVCSGPFATMLQHVEPQIIERVNRFFGYAAVARITLRHGELPTRPARAAQPDLKPLSPEVSSMLKPIGDAGLRASLEALAQAMSVTKGPPVFD
jgi:hypothetical protein